MSKSKGLTNQKIRLVLLAGAIAAVIAMVISNLGTFGNIFLVIIGFGAVVLVHEFGHFVVAKSVGVKVEAFSVGFPPVLAGILRTEKGYRIRILPDFAGSRADQSGDRGWCFTVGGSGRAGETEYRIGLIPFGGFVKMLGQEDTGAAGVTDDPRSFANKPLRSRLAVIAAGVFCNALSALLIFVTVFLIGIELLPAVVGSVRPGSPAEQAGLRAGDEIIEIAGKRENLDFSYISIAAALSDRDEEVGLTVRHADGTAERLSLKAERMQGSRLRMFGIEAADSLTVGRVRRDEGRDVAAEAGLRAGDRIRSVNGTDVDSSWQLREIVEAALAPSATLLVQRRGQSGNEELVECEVPLTFGYVRGRVESESDLSHVCSMVPRLWVVAAADEVGSRGGKSLKRGDIILSAGEVANPTYKELREVTQANVDKSLAMEVLRTGPDGGEEKVKVTVKPRQAFSSDRAVIGIVLGLDAAHPVVARTIDAPGGVRRLEIPRGATIVSVAGVEVSDYYDIIREIRRNEGERVTIAYRLGEGTTGQAVCEVADADAAIGVESDFAQLVLFESLKRLYKADGPIEAVKMGYERTILFISQTYATLKSLIEGLVSPEDLMGPVGIVTMSYRVVAEQPFIYYVYFIGLINACIAVFNFLPVPPLDGGLVVVLLVEKLKGSALSQRAQGIIAYAGWILIGTLFLYVTFNDIARLVRGIFS